MMGVLEFLGGWCDFWSLLRWEARVLLYYTYTIDTYSHRGTRDDVVWKIPWLISNFILFIMHKHLAIQKFQMVKF